MPDNRKMSVKTVIDILMAVLLMLLMSYQITGELAHEWLGMAMVTLVIVHQIFNRKWYGVLLKGRYNLYRISSILCLL